MDYSEKTLGTTMIYKGNIIDVEKMTVELPDGKSATRDIVRHKGAAAVIPITDENELYMVTQFRKPLEAETIEIPAGKLDPGEEPAVCAKRELKEETGLDAENIRYLLTMHTTPGFCDEKIHLFAATGLKAGDACADEDEFISARKIEISKLIDMVMSHEITDAKTIIGILLADKIVKGEI